MEKNLQNLIQFKQILKTTSIKELIKAKQAICLQDSSIKELILY